MERMPERSRGDDKRKRVKRQEWGESDRKRRDKRQREEVENEEVAIISLPVFDQWSMGN